MPLDPDRVREAGEKAQSLSKRFDAFLERRAINDAADDEDEDEDLDLDPAEEALNASTLGAPPNKTPDPPDLNEPWYGNQ